MIYGKMWYVVKPTVGVPLFFVFVAATSLIVHIGILTHTTWFAGFLEGHARKAAAVSLLAPPAVPAITVQQA